MGPTKEQVQAEFERLVKADILTPQERRFLALVIAKTLDGDTTHLYQKAIARELDLSEPRHVAVIASRVRAKLSQHYAAHSDSPVRIEMSSWGYELRFIDQEDAIAKGVAPLIDRSSQTLPDAILFGKYARHESQAGGEQNDPLSTLASALRDVDHFVIRFPTDCSPSEMKGVLTALSDYFRACGGLGFAIELDAEHVSAGVPVGERR